MDLSENQMMLKYLKDHFKVSSKVYGEELKIKEDLMKSLDLTPDQKSIFLTEQDQYINNLVLEINNTSNKIKQLEEEISSLTLIISEFENNL